MKHIVKTLALAWLSVSTVGAGPVQKTEINADAKWLLHLDVEQFRASKMGGYVVSQLLEPKIQRQLTELKRKMKFDVDPNKILEKIGSVTIYGTDYKSPKENAVVMIKADADIQAAFVGVLAGFALAGTNSPVQLTQSQVGKVTVYAMKDQAYCAVLPGKVVALSTSRAAIDRAADVLDGRAKNLASGRKFSEFPQEKAGFFFLATAEGFNDDMALPPQAKLLQMADGGQIALGEDAGQLFLNLALKAKTPEIVTQMQQVIQGLIAMASLGQTEDQDISQLIKAIKVNATEDVVSVRVEYPTDKIIERINEKVGERRHRDGAAEESARMVEQQARMIEQQQRALDEAIRRFDEERKNGGNADAIEALQKNIAKLQQELVKAKNSDAAEQSAAPEGKAE